MIAGVCDGLGQYLNADPTVIRLIFIVTALLGGPGLIVYLLIENLMRGRRANTINIQSAKGGSS
jgi:phage shock protein C